MKPRIFIILMLRVFIRRMMPFCLIHFSDMWCFSADFFLPFPSIARATKYMRAAIHSSTNPNPIQNLHLIHSTIFLSGAGQKGVERVSLFWHFSVEWRRDIPYWHAHSWSVRFDQLTAVWLIFCPRLSETLSRPRNYQICWDRRHGLSFLYDLAVNDSVFVMWTFPFWSFSFFSILLYFVFIVWLSVFSSSCFSASSRWITAFDITRSYTPRRCR